ncbi:IclR family transcriptional regulator [Algirhabdus cladophorae]|uniref:IclR family transcriptional regulator n=1 Tax=Algirhabdus cladophorae TaxID=3377108 RepID=UPI003B845EB5
MTDSQRIPTNLRTLLILEALGKSDDPMTPTQINEHIGLPKQTVHRLCTTLEEEGFLTREADGKHLRPSRRARQMGFGLLHASHHHIVRHQVLADLAASVGETVNFVVPEDTGMHYLDRVDTGWPFRIQLPVGSNVPFHCTASGKAFMASLSPSQRANFVSGLNLKSLTERTHRSAETLLEDLKSCAKRGYALDDQEFMEGMVAIAVPVIDASGRYAGSIAFHGPSQRLDVDTAVARLPELKSAAKKLSDAMFS